MVVQTTSSTFAVRRKVTTYAQALCAHSGSYLASLEPQWNRRHDHVMHCIFVLLLLLLPCGGCFRLQAVWCRLQTRSTHGTSNVIRSRRARHWAPPLWVRLDQGWTLRGMWPVTHRSLRRSWPRWATRLAETELYWGPLPAGRQLVDPFLDRGSPPPVG